MKTNGEGRPFVPFGAVLRRNIPVRSIEPARPLRANFR